MMKIRETFPKSIAEVSLSWINAVLPGAVAAVSFQVSELAEQGVTSQVYLLDLEFDRTRAQPPLRLLLKIATDDVAVRETLREGAAYRREVDFYHRLGDAAGIPVPRCYALGFDAADNTFLLLLEYVENSSVRDVVSGTVEEVRQAVDGLADLHGRWWGRDNELTWVEQDTGTDLLDMRIKRAREALLNIRQVYSDRVGATVPALLELYIEAAHLLALDANAGPKTLCHGDYHRKQLLFPENRAGRFCVLDWQTVALGRGVDDLARIVVTGLRNDDRQRHEVALVERYHRALVAQGIGDYPLEQVWEHYYLGMARLLVTHCMVFAGFNLQPLVDEWSEKGMDWFEVFFHWPSAAIEEHDVLTFVRQRVDRLRLQQGGPDLDVAATECLS